MNYFFDTSALVKLYHQEKDSQEVLDIFNAYEEIYFSELVIIEYHSVIHRKLKEKLLEKTDVNRILKRLDNDIKYRFKLLTFNASVIENAKKIFQFLGDELLVRSLDVIQMGFFKSYLNDSDTFLTFDLRQKAAVKELKSKGFFKYRER